MATNDPSIFTKIIENIIVGCKRWFRNRFAAEERKPLLSSSSEECDVVYKYKLENLEPANKKIKKGVLYIRLVNGNIEYKLITSKLSKSPDIRYNRKHKGTIKSTDKDLDGFIIPKKINLLDEEFKDWLLEILVKRKVIPSKVYQEIGDESSSSSRLEELLEEIEREREDENNEELLEEIERGDENNNDKYNFEKRIKELQDANKPTNAKEINNFNNELNKLCADLNTFVGFFHSKVIIEATKDVGYINNRDFVEDMKKYIDRYNNLKKILKGRQNNDLINYLKSLHEILKKALESREKHVGELLKEIKNLKLMLPNSESVSNESDEDNHQLKSTKITIGSLGEYTPKDVGPTATPVGKVEKNSDISENIASSNSNPQPTPFEAFNARKMKNAGKGANEKDTSKENILTADNFQSKFIGGMKGKLDDIKKDDYTTRAKDNKNTENTTNQKEKDRRENDKHQKQLFEDCEIEGDDNIFKKGDTKLFKMEYKENEAICELIHPISLADKDDMDANTATALAGIMDFIGKLQRNFHGQTAVISGDNAFEIFLHCYDSGADIEIDADTIELAQQQANNGNETKKAQIEEYKKKIAQLGVVNKCSK